MSSNYIFFVSNLIHNEYLPVPDHIQKDLEQATKPEEIESIIYEKGTQLAQLFNENNYDLSSYSAASLMSEVLKSKGIINDIIMTDNIYYEERYYVIVGDQYYDPTDETGVTPPLFVPPVNWNNVREIIKEQNQ